MISLTIAHRYADSNCKHCEGTGAVINGGFGGHYEEYCECVLKNKLDKESEDYLEGKRQDNEI